MNAGRELDALVSRHVFDAEPCACGPIGGYDPQTGICSRCGVPPSAHYSTDIAAAWLVWEKVAQVPKRFVNLQNCCRAEGFAWCAIISDEAGLFEGQGDTAPLAICLAALKAVGVDVSANGGKNGGSEPESGPI